MNFYTCLLVVNVAFCVALAMPSNSHTDFAFQQVKKINETAIAKPKGKLGLYGFSFKDCGGPSAAVKGNISISPTDPITLPGSFKVSFNATFGVALKSPLKAVLQIKKKEFIWIDIPCIENVGSCTYDDVCKMIPHTPPSGCPPPLKAADLPCKCPFNAGKYILPPSEIDVLTIPPDIPSFLADGDFQVNVKLYDGATELACADIAFTLKITT